MGIPKFVKTLMTRYPLIVGRIRNNKPNLSNIPIIDNLFLDLNSTIHCLSHSDAYNILALVKEKSLNEIYEETFKFIEQIVELINPKSFLMITLDGVSPASKIRSRLISGYIRSLDIPEEITKFLEELGLPKKNDFNRKEISSCTEFMINLEKYLDEKIQQKKSEKGNIFQKIEIVLSLSNVPGEAEYKIMNEIRYKNKRNKNLVHCIYSNDADYILLSLLIHDSFIIILKEGICNKSNNKYNFEFKEENNLLQFNEMIFISVLKEYLYLEFRNLNNEMNSQNSVERVCSDFVLLCLLLGNDFIPGLMSLDKNGEIFEFLLNSYKNWKKKQKNCDFLTYDKKINFNNFILFMKELSYYEGKYINFKYCLFERIFKKRNKQLQDSLIDIYNEESKNIESKDNYEKLKEVMNSKEIIIDKINNILDNSRLLLDEEYKQNKKIEEYFFYKLKKIYIENPSKAKKNYYREKFSFDIEKEEGKNELKELILNYFEGLQWCFSYYNGFLNWDWYYKYDYYPCISDISNYNYKDFGIIYEHIINNVGEPFSPYMIQCLTFPSTSFNLIHEKYQKVKNIIPHYYDTKMKFDNNGFPYPNQMIVTTPKLKSNDIEELKKFDKSLFNQNICCFKESYKKEFIYKKNSKNKEEYNHEIKNVILNEINNTHNNLISLINSRNFQFKEFFFNRIYGKNRIKINTFFTMISLDKKNELSIKEVFQHIIISYGFPLVKCGVLLKLYNNNKFYTHDDIGKGTGCPDYKKEIREDYEYIGIKIEHISYLIEVLPIESIEEGKFKFDYEYMFLVPFEITSLNNDNKSHQEILSCFKEMNKINDNQIDLKKIKKQLKKKKRNIFYFHKDKTNKEKINNNIIIKDKNEITNFIYL